MGTPNTRKDVGKAFSEAARLLWVAASEHGLSQRALGRALGAHEGEIMKLLYGDKRARLEIAARAEELYGIPSPTWFQEPTVAFVLPALRKRARAKAAA